LTIATFATGESPLLCWFCYASSKAHTKNG